MVSNDSTAKRIGTKPVVDFAQQSSPQGRAAGSTATDVAARIGRLDTLDLLQARHHQVQAILASLSLCFDASGSTLTPLTVQNTIWAAQEMLEQAQGAVAGLAGSAA